MRLNRTPFGPEVLFLLWFFEAERFRVVEGDTYKGTLYFDPKSVRVFDPVGSDVVRAIWPEFKGFSHVKWSLNPNNYPAFEKRLTGVEGPK
jgi:hypothetical protein